MSKTTRSTDFRKVNVDELDEERFQDDAGETSTSSGPSESEVQNLLNAKKNLDALKLLLKDPPYNAGSKEKSSVFNLVIRVLSQYKSSEIDASVKELSSTELDTLMKYLYRGFGEPADNTCGILLSWHEKVYAKGGVGCIVRVLADRKSV